MAGITGRFDADFQPFLKAVEQANTSLEKLEGHTKDVNTSMDALLGTAKEVAGAFGIAFSVGRSDPEGTAARQAGAGPRHAQ